MSISIGTASVRQNLQDMISINSDRQQWMSRLDSCIEMTNSRCSRSRRGRSSDKFVDEIYLIPRGQIEKLAIWDTCQPNLCKNIEKAFYLSELLKRRRCEQNDSFGKNDTAFGGVDSGKSCSILEVCNICISAIFTSTNPDFIAANI